MTTISAATLDALATFAAADAPAAPASATVTSADVEKHLDLVNQVVARCMKKLPGNVDRGDLVAAGMYGLVTSLERNGGDQGEAFAGYAKMRTRGAIIDELRAQDWLSRRARWAATAQQNGYAGPTALVGFDDVAESERASSLADHDSPDALSLLELLGEREEIREAVAQLPARESEVIRLHYFEGVEFKAIAQRLGVSAPRVSQLHARALGRLREALVAEAA
jgi:RNA polymerase sigma factor for flagellar operon FliA